jgi:hypothetical protein
VRTETGKSKLTLEDLGRRIVNIEVGKTDLGIVLRF